MYVRIVENSHYCKKIQPIPTILSYSNNSHNSLLMKLSILTDVNNSHYLNSSHKSENYH